LFVVIAWQVAALETAVTSVLLPAASHQVGYIPPPLTSLVSASTAFTSAYFSICKFSGGNNWVLVKVGLLDQKYSTRSITRVANYSLVAAPLW